MFSRSTIFAIITIIIANIWNYSQDAVSSNYSHDVQVTGRLATNARPLHYNISIDTDLDFFVFSGHVEIDVLITRTSNEITLHSANLSIINVQVLDSNNTSLTPIRFQIISSEQRLTIHYPPYLSKQVVKIKINYEGSLNQDTMVGFFAGNYINKKGETKRYAFTFFEPVYARMVFPCFDEPNFKATFTVSLGRRPGYISLSNMPITRTWQKKNYIMDVFETSPNMSTYLISFAICDFHKINSGNFRLFAPLQIIQERFSNYLLEIASPILNAIENYTEVKFSLKKLDQVIIPNFTNKAMENWGLIGYSDDNVSLYGESPIKRKNDILQTVTQEFVLQWFGNLVTPLWWNFVWLKEGFASYLSHKIAQKVKPAWRMEDQYLIIVQSTFDLDTGTASPLSVAVRNLYEIEEVFKPVTYHEAGAVLRMLDHALSTELFREGLTHYLNKLKYGLTKPAYLWDAIQETINSQKQEILPGDLTLLTIVETWETQSSYPLVTIDRDYEEQRSTVGVIERSQVHQQIYVENYHFFAGLHDKRRWYIPLNWATKDNPDFSNTSAMVWLEARGMEELAFSVSDDAWVIVNKQATGYYRVNYDDKNWMLIIDYLNTPDYDKIHVLNRAQLIDDAFHLAITSQLYFPIVLDLIKYLHRETDYIVHRTFFRNLEYFNKMACWAPLYNLFEQFVVTLLERSLLKLGYEDVSHTDSEHINNLHRRDVIYWACRMNSRACRTTTTSKLNSPRVSVSDNLLISITCGGLRGASQSLWEKVAKKYLTYDGLVNNILFELGCSENKKILLYYVEGELTQKNLKVFERIYSKSNVGKNFVFYYILAHFNELHERFGNEIGHVIVGLSELLSTSDHLFWIKDLKRRATTITLQLRFDTAITNIEKNSNWANLNYKVITGWIKTEL